MALEFLSCLLVQAWPGCSSLEFARIRLAKRGNTSQFVP